LGLHNGDPCVFEPTKHDCLPVRNPEIPVMILRVMLTLGFDARRRQTLQFGWNSQKISRARLITPVRAVSW